MQHDLRDGVVIIGAGQAGGRAAETLRSLGYPGPITLVGDEAVPPYERPPLSKQFLEGALPLDCLLLHSQSYYDEQDIVLRLDDCARAINRRARHVKLDSGQIIPFSTLIIATGSRPRRLATMTAAARVHYLRSVSDSAKLASQLVPGRHILIIGAGFIGLEVAATARARGCRVTVLEAAPHPLSRGVLPEVSAFFVRLHRANGVDLRMSVLVDEIVDRDEHILVRTTEGAVIAGDTVLVAIGVQPNVELGAACGLAVDNGIVVDEFGRTSDPAIYAAGDVTCHFNPRLGRHLRLEAWQNAQNQAIAVACAIGGQPVPYAEIPWLWSNQFATNLQVLGAPERWDRVVWRGTPQDGRFVALQFCGEILVGALGVNSGKDIRSLKRLMAEEAHLAPHILSNPDIRPEEARR